nr:hypothetical protein CFP56_01056 [Quercus suber]
MKCDPGASWFLSCAREHAHLLLRIKRQHSHLRRGIGARLVQAHFRLHLLSQQFSQRLSDRCPIHVWRSVDVAHPERDRTPGAHGRPREQLQRLQHSSFLHPAKSLRGIDPRDDYGVQAARVAQDLAGALGAPPNLGAEARQPEAGIALQQQDVAEEDELDLAQQDQAAAALEVQQVWIDTEKVERMAEDQLEGGVGVEVREQVCGQEWVDEQEAERRRLVRDRGDAHGGEGMGGWLTGNQMAVDLFT